VVALSNLQVEVQHLVVDPTILEEVELPITIADLMIDSKVNIVIIEVADKILYPKEEVIIGIQILEVRLPRQLPEHSIEITTIIIVIIIVIKIVRTTITIILPVSIAKIRIRTSHSNYHYPT